ncbi:MULTISPECIES: glycosyltransferase 61 family protein [Bacillaceae]|uniref:glycosyltransferase family 61 protein n=1 Tax=Bacillaceae TaxID=186817 RepID=UPI000BA53E3E|nr:MULTISPECIES: glycosyltransferase 61 family protein [Bacillaceae]PAE26332.1 hypothetical protein CHI10_03475 [Bacillus sp. 7894-2]URM31154.1 glycosyltransferase 61 family protein [Cytobacillus firmus]
MSRNFMKVIPYQEICTAKDFKEFKLGILPENTLYHLSDPERTRIIPPVRPFPGIRLPNECVTQDFYVASLKNTLCLRNQTIIQDRRFVLPDSFRHYEFNASTTNLIYHGRSNRFSLKVKSQNTKYQSGDYIFLSGEKSGFGHFLLEVISRLWITKYIDVKNVKFIMNSEDRKSWQLDLLKPFGISLKQIIYLDKPIVCERLHIPVQSFCLRKYTSTFAYKTWKTIGDYYDRGTGFEKIYVSRSKLKNQRRVLLNEKSVERIFSLNGYKIIHPEELKVSEQINLFRNAKVIAGTSGSGMYNSVFLQNHPKVLILASNKFFKMSDILVNTSTGGKLHYFLGQTAELNASGNKAIWTLNTKHLHQFLKEF